MYCKETEYSITDINKTKARFVLFYPDQWKRISMSLLGVRIFGVQKLCEKVDLCIDQTSHLIYK
jgi:hypothetical protein